MKDERTLVVGATGFLGTQIVRLLREEQAAVRAIVRPSADPAKRRFIEELRAEPFSADLKDPQSIESACRGVTTIVSTATAVVSRQPGDSLQAVDERGQLALVNAAERAGVRHFVFVSIPPVDVDYAYQRAKRRVEARLRESQMSFAVLQPAHFMEVWLGPMLGFDPAHGSARVFGAGDRPVSWVSVEDVARFAVKAAAAGRFAATVLPLGGPEALSPIQVIRIFEDVGAPKTVVEHVPEAALVAQVAAARDPLDEAFAGTALAAARGLTINPDAALQLLPGRMKSVRDHAGRTVNTRAR
jgi:NADH dehydrogenase